MKRKILLLSALVCAANVYAEDPVTTPKAEGDENGKFTFSGYIDSYYIANLNKPASRSNLGAAGNARAFDQRAGQFSLGLIQTKIGYSTAKSDVIVDLTFGPNADLGNYGNLIGPLGPGGSSIAIKQAYFNWKATEKLTLTAGQFGTHIGYEVIDAPVNYNYSLSNLFNNGPFYHIGAKATYAFSDKTSLMLGVVNNVDALNDNNRKKGLIGQFFVSPASGWNVYLNGIYSNEANPDSLGNTPAASYSLFDLTTTYQVTEKFFLGLNAAVGSQKGDYQGYTFTDRTKTWGGVALYSNYTVSSNFGIGARYEYFDNTGGARALRNRLGDGTSVNSITFTGNITAADGHLLLKPEVRIDSYAKPASSAEGNLQFEDSKGNFTKSSQTTVGLAMIYKF
jgi:hypothetical protein